LIALNVFARPIFRRNNVRPHIRFFLTGTGLYPALFTLLMLAVAPSFYRMRGTCYGMSVNARLLGRASYAKKRKVKKK
jgi:hypothetical protein